MTCINAPRVDAFGHENRPEVSAVFQGADGKDFGLACQQHGGPKSRSTESTNVALWKTASGAMVDSIDGWRASKKV